MQRKVNKIIIHCSYTKANMDIGADVIRDWHVNGNGWSDIGYNAVINRSGEIEPGRDLDGDGNWEEEFGAHARGHNSDSIGICLVGGMSSDGKPEFNFTKRQMDAMESLVIRLIAKYDGAEVIGHNDVDSSKSCPCFDVKQYFGV